MQYGYGRYVAEVLELAGLTTKPSVAGYRSRNPHQPSLVSDQCRAAEAAASALTLSVSAFRRSQKQELISSEVKVGAASGTGSRRPGERRTCWTMLYSPTLRCGLPLSCQGQQPPERPCAAAGCPNACTCTPNSRWLTRQVNAIASQRVSTHLWPVVGLDACRTAVVQSDEPTAHLWPHDEGPSQHRRTTPSAISYHQSRPPQTGRVVTRNLDSCSSAYLLHDEKEVHIGGRRRSNVRDYCHDSPARLLRNCAGLLRSLVILVPNR
jgi:hypothetical protein